jgi:hypothetical protein
VSACPKILYFSIVSTVTPCYAMSMDYYLVWMCITDQMEGCSQDL